MAVTIGNITYFEEDNDGATNTFSHNNDGDFLLVFNAGIEGSGTSASNVTFGGDSCTAQTNADGTGPVQVGLSVYYLSAPTSGTTNVVVSPGSGWSTLLGTYAISLIDAHSTTPIGAGSMFEGSDQTSPYTNTLEPTGDANGLVLGLSFSRLTALTNVTASGGDLTDVSNRDYGGFGMSYVGTATPDAGGTNVLSLTNDPSTSGNHDVRFYAIEVQAEPPAATNLAIVGMG